MHLSGLHIHPVKSCRGHSVQRACLDAFGLVGDRRYMVVSEEEGRFLTQRQIPAMARIDTLLTQSHLELSASKHGSVSIPTAEKGSSAAPTRKVIVWKDTVEADDCGLEAAEWLTHVLAMPARLVRMGPGFTRAIPSRKIPPSLAAARQSACVSFADGFPFLVISQASLDDLNDRLIETGQEPVPMNRFRPNIVIAASAPYAEDTWTRFQIGDTRFHAATPCARCVITTTDQQTGERSAEPLRTLARYRRDPYDPTDVNFGRNAIHETFPSVLSIGDPVTLLPLVSGPRTPESETPA